MGTHSIGNTAGDGELDGFAELHHRGGVQDRGERLLGTTEQTILGHKESLLAYLLDEDNLGDKERKNSY